LGIAGLPFCWYISSATEEAIAKTKELAVIREAGQCQGKARGMPFSRGAESKSTFALEIDKLTTGEGKVFLSQMRHG
jgi:hypothetical protein